MLCLKRESKWAKVVSLSIFGVEAYDIEICNKNVIQNT